MSKKRMGLWLVLCLLLSLVCATTVWGKAPCKVNIIAQKSSHGTSEYTLYWNSVAGADGYQMRLYDMSAGSYKWKNKELRSGHTKVVLKNIRGAQYYRFQIRAYKQQKNEKTRKVKKVYGSYRTVYIAHQPKVKFSWKSPTKTTASWNAIDGATSYTVYLKRPGGSYKKLGTTKRAEYTIPRLKANERYYVYVVAKKKVGKQWYYTPRTYSYNFQLSLN